MTSLVDEGRAVGVVYTCFRKVFDTVSHSIIIDKVMKYDLNKRAARWTERKLLGGDSSLVEYSWRQYFTSSLMTWRKGQSPALSKLADDTKLGKVVD